MTPSQYKVLHYLNDKMEANAAMIGEYLKPAGKAKSVAAPVIGRLYRSGYITHIRELNAWRITKTGRQALNEINGT